MTGPRSVLECLAWYVERDGAASEVREQARRLLAKHGKAPAAPKASEPAKPVGDDVQQGHTFTLDDGRVVTTTLERTPAPPAKPRKLRAKRDPVPVEVVELPEAKAEPKAYPLASRFAGLGAA